MGFVERAALLPQLGIGVSTEYGAGESADALNVERLQQQYPQFAQFLEIGIEITKGLDQHAEQWIATGRPCTYHFLDINLDEPDDFDDQWLDRVMALANHIEPAWMCGDAGLWHFGRRDRGHMLLLPPILSPQCATAMAEGIQRLRSHTGYEVLPENPPGSAYVGPLHLLDFYARICDEADTGMLLDCAHLAIFQRMRSHDPLTALNGFPLERIIELHVAGGTLREQNGFEFVEDTHTANVLPDTWHILEYLAPRCPNLKAVVFECERNQLAANVAGFERIQQVLEDSVISV